MTIFSVNAWILCFVGAVFAQTEPVEEALIDGSRYNVANEQLAASSFFHDPDWDSSTTQSRLYTEKVYGVGTGSWSAQTSDYNQWIEVDFKDAFYITAIATQGRPGHGYMQWVTSYKISYSLGEDFSFYIENGVTKIFSGNTDSNTVVKNDLQYPVKARKIRLQPTTWREWISLRWEVYGFPVPDEEIVRQVNVTCDPSEIVAILSVIGLSNPGGLYVGNNATDPACQAQVDGYVATFNVQLDACDVNIEDQGDDTIVHTYQISSTTGDEEILLNTAGGTFQCNFTSNDVINTELNSVLVSRTYVGSGSGHYSFTMELLDGETGESFTEVPSIETDNMVMVGVHFQGPEVLDMIVDSCWMSPKDDPDLKHFLIQDGCFPAADVSQVSVHPLTDRITAHDYYFSFLNFVFREHENSGNVLSCDVHVCNPVSDPDCVNLNGYCDTLSKRNVRRYVGMTFSTGRLSFYTKA